ncbi:MAG: hypothetical protein K2X87_34970 [Gemmataceae bacterium]|nr:hypothetical protein [Gemmataceae bacterium]
MPTTPDAVLAEEEQRAVEVYDRLVRPTLRPEDDGKFVVIAFDEDDFEVDADDHTAINRLLARRPNARLWLMRTGPEPACRIRGVTGGRA